jgi:N-acetylglucosaminyldiphosphoundecaprenol N-acetyl-beta-D-mannosaminyltransferase
MSTLPPPVAHAPRQREVPARVDPETAPVLGIPLALTSYDGAMDWMDALVARRERGYVVAAAVHCVMLCQDDPELMDAVLGASLTLPDGQPLVWALAAMGYHLPSRVYGPELMARYFARSARTGTRMYLYGGRNQGALVQLALNLRRRFPGVQIVGGYSPPYRELTDDERAWVVEDIERSEADVVWVGIGVPKQEKWMAEMRPHLTTPVLIGVGAAFDFHADLIPQAPSWMQASGLEWSYRLGREPRRLWRRYLTYNPRFVAAIARELASSRSDRASLPASTAAMRGAARGRGKRASR